MSYIHHVFSYYDDNFSITKVYLFQVVTEMTSISPTSNEKTMATSTNESAEISCTYALSNKPCAEKCTLIPLNMALDTCISTSNTSCCSPLEVNPDVTDNLTLSLEDIDTESFLSFINPTVPEWEWPVLKRRRSNQYGRRLKYCVYCESRVECHKFFCKNYRIKRPCCRVTTARKEFAKGCYGCSSWDRMYTGRWFNEKITNFF